MKGLEDTWAVDKELVYSSGFEKEAVAVTQIVNTCIKSSWSIVFTLRLRKL